MVRRLKNHSRTLPPTRVRLMTKRQSLHHIMKAVSSLTAWTWRTQHTGLPTAVGPAGGVVRITVAHFYLAGRVGGYTDELSLQRTPALELQVAAVAAAVAARRLPPCLVLPGRVAALVVSNLFLVCLHLGIQAHRTEVPHCQASCPVADLLPTTVVAT